MTNTTYYDLNIVEGTDIVNPLIVDNPNYNKIDEVMHDNAVSGVTLATEIASATVHAITRENSECSVIRFIATSAWKAGDTITVDGVPVTALLPSGETLPNGAYVINANVLCILTGTNLTVYAERKKTDSANEIAYNGTTVSAELDEINSNLKNMEWKLIASASPTSENYQLAIPLDIAEICVVIRPNGNPYNEMIVSIPTTILSEEYRNIGVTRARYENSDEKCFATLGLLRGSSNFVVNMESCNIGANDVRINSYIWVYGKK